MKFSVIIPTYNHCDDLLKPCVESIIKFTDLNQIELVISANGCKDNTMPYLNYVRSVFEQAGCQENFKIVWSDQPLGYSGACNAGIRVSKSDKIILLNNDCVFLDQPKNQWLDILDKPFDDPDCGISCIIKSQSEPAGRDFAVFFCVAIKRAVFDKIGLLNEEYGVGGGEDTEFCIEAEKAGFKVIEVFEKRWDGSIFTGNFPIYHRGEGTVHDTNLVPDYQNVFLKNSLKLAKKYNYEWYRWRLSNYWERAVFLKGDPVFPRETTRYSWAAENLVGNKVLEIGCSDGYGIQFMPKNIQYTGVDYDPIIVSVAKEQNWGYDAQFFSSDINKFDLEQYDTIIAFEVIEHIKNGLDVVERLKKHCKRLMITVPMNEPPGFWGPHHLLHGLNESHFPDAEYKYINEKGQITDSPHPITQENPCNLLLCKWTNG
jgi:glycosyltransferase involved in cell wall biosynthesis